MLLSRERFISLGSGRRLRCRPSSLTPDPDSRAGAAGAIRLRIEASSCSSARKCGVLSAYINSGKSSAAILPVERLCGTFEQSFGCRIGRLRCGYRKRVIRRRYSGGSDRPSAERVTVSVSPVGFQCSERIPRRESVHRHRPRRDPSYFSTLFDSNATVPPVNHDHRPSAASQVAAGASDDIARRAATDFIVHPEFRFYNPSMRQGYVLWGGMASCAAVVNRRFSCA